MKKYLLPALLAAFALSSTAQTITTQSLSGTVCAGVSFHLAYTLTGTFTAGNTFTAQLSNSSGSFTGATTIGTLVADTAYPISVTIPASTAAGAGYRIRVISSSPAVTGADNGANLTLNAIPAAPTLALTQTGCVNTDTLTVTGTGSAPQISWYLNGTPVHAGTPYQMTVIAGGNGRGSAANQLNEFEGIFLDTARNLYVADRYNYRIQKFPAGSTSATNGITVGGGNGIGANLNDQIEPTGVFVDSLGKTWLSDFYYQDLEVFQAGSSQTSLDDITAGFCGGAGNADDQLNYPRSIWIRGGYQFTPDLNNNRVQEFLPPATAFNTCAIGTTVAGGNGVGIGPNQLKQPNNVFFDSLGYMYVSDGGNNRIQKFTNVGGSINGITAAGGNGQGPAANQLYLPTGSYVDGAGNLYVADEGNGRVQKFPPGSNSATGGVTVAGGYGYSVATNQINGAMGVFVDKYGSIYTGDYGNSQVDKWSPSAAAYNYYVPYSAGNYTATYTTAAGCTSLPSDTIAVAPASPPSLLLTASATTLCAGIADTFRITPINATGATPSYTWYKNTNYVLSDSTTYTTTLNNGDSVWVVETITTPCDGPYTVYSNTVHITVNPTVYSPTLRLSAPRTLLCGTTADTFTAIATSYGTSPTYQWYKNQNPVGTNSPTYIDAGLADFDAVYAVLTVTSACAYPNPLTADSPITVRVYATPPAPTLSISGSGCLGSDSLEAHLTSIASQIVWQRAGIGIDTTVTIPSDSGATVAGGNGSGANANQFNSPTGVVVDHQGYIYVADERNQRVQKFPPGSTSLTNGVTVAGGNGQGSAANQLYAPTYLFIDTAGYLYVSDAGNNRVQKFPPGSTSATSGVTVAGGNGSGSAADQLNFPQGIYVKASGDLYVADQQNYRVQKFPAGSTSSTAGVTVAGLGYSGSSNGAITPVAIGFDRWGYMYAVDGSFNSVEKFPPNSTLGTIPVTIVTGNYSGTYDLYAPKGIYVDSVGDFWVANSSDNDIVRFPAGCTTFSSPVRVAGGFRAGSTHGLLNSPSGVWLDSRGNIYVADLGNNRIQEWGAGLPDTTYRPATGGSYTAVYTTSGGCSSPASNAVVVNTVAIPTVSITASHTTLCAGATDTFTASVTNPGTINTYQWYKNGTAVGTNSNTYTSSTLANSDSVWATFTTNTSCTTPATSNKIHLSITALVTPGVTVTASHTTLCAGSVDSFTASPSNGGLSPSYQWYKDGLPVGTSAATYSTAAISSGDSVWVVLTSNAQCASAPTATATKVHITLTTPVTPQVSIAITAGAQSSCTNTPVTFTATPTHGGAGPQYNFMVNSASVQNGSGSTYLASAPANGEVVSVVLTSDQACISTPTATSNDITLTVYPLPSPVITQHGNDTLSTGVYTSYQWYDNGSSQSNYTTQSIVITQSGSYSVSVTDSNGCSNTSQALPVLNVGITTLSADSRLAIHPNPNNGSFILQSSGAIGQTFIISDMLGRELTEQAITSDQQNVNLKNLASGSYVLQIKGSSARAIKFTVDN